MLIKYLGAEVAFKPNIFRNRVKQYKSASAISRSVSLILTTFIALSVVSNGQYKYDPKFVNIYYSTIIIMIGAVAVIFSYEIKKFILLDNSYANHLYNKIKILSESYDLNNMEIRPIAFQAGGGSVDAAINGKLIDKQKNDIYALNERTLDTKNIVDSLSSKIDIHHQENTDNLNDIKTVYQKHNKQLNDHQSSIKTVNSNLEQNKQQITKLDTSYNELASLERDLRSSLTALDTKHESISSGVSLNAQKITDIQIDHANIINQLQNDINQQFTLLQNKDVQIDGAINQLQNNINQQFNLLKNKDVQIDSTITQLQNDINQQFKLLQNKDVQIDGVISQLQNDINQQFTLLQNKDVQMDRTIAQLQLIIRDIESKNVNQDNVLSYLQNLANDIQSKNTSQDEALVSLQQLINTIQINNTSQDELVAHLQTSIQDIQKKNVNQDNILSYLQKLINEIQHKNVDQDNALSYLKTFANDIEVKNNNQDQILENLQLAIHKMQNENLDQDQLISQLDLLIKDIQANSIDKHEAVSKAELLLLSLVDGPYSHNITKEYVDDIGNKVIDILRDAYSIYHTVSSEDSEEKQIVAAQIIEIQNIMSTFWQNGEELLPANMNNRILNVVRKLSSLRKSLNCFDVLALLGQRTGKEIATLNQKTSLNQLANEANALDINDYTVDINTFNSMGKIKPLNFKNNYYYPQEQSRFMCQRLMKLAIILRKYLDTIRTSEEFNVLFSRLRHKRVENYNLPSAFHVVYKTNMAEIIYRCDALLQKFDHSALSSELKSAAPKIVNFCRQSVQEDFTFTAKYCAPAYNPQSIALLGDDLRHLFIGSKEITQAIFEDNRIVTVLDSFISKCAYLEDPYSEGTNLERLTYLYYSDELSQVIKLCNVFSILKPYAESYHKNCARRYDISKKIKADLLSQQYPIDSEIDYIREQAIRDQNIRDELVDLLNTFIEFNPYIRENHKISTLEKLINSSNMIYWRVDEFPQCRNDHSDFINNNGSMMTVNSVSLPEHMISKHPSHTHSLLLICNYMEKTCMTFMNLLTNLVEHHGKHG